MGFEFVKIQERVLYALLLIGREADYKELSKETLLTRQQVYDAIRNLKQRKLVLVRYEKRRNKNEIIVNNAKIIINPAKMYRLKKIIGKYYHPIMELDWTREKYEKLYENKIRAV